VCGLAGVFRDPAGGRSELEQLAGRMADQLVHRGPDDRGVWCDEQAGIALGFRRLSIIDLSENGHQPMRSASGRFTAVFNGEIYNYVELGRELSDSGARFRGHSDTEVMLAAFERWGVEAAIRRFIGMFAIAVWDHDSRCLHLVRDRLGIKPLFVLAQPGLIAFGSELKALFVVPGFDRELDARALGEYLRYLYVPAPRTIFRNVTKLLPGHILTIRDPRAPLPESVPYWSVERVVHSSGAEASSLSVEEAVLEGERLLQDAVRLRMRADVPVGAFLSGGIDSSTVVALMQACSPRPVKTYTIGFDDGEYDEAPRAARVAEHLGTDHTEILLTAQAALDLVPQMADTFDEPFADPSQIPTYLVCRESRRAVTVALSGDGGDEIFGGYNRYIAGQHLLRRAARVPSGVRRLVAAGVTAVSPDRWDQIYGALAPVLPRRARQRLAGEKLHKIGFLLRQSGVPGMYRSLLSAWQDPAAVADVGEADGVAERILAEGNGLSLLDRMMLCDQLSYLPDDLLAKVDRASMAVSLEVRLPLLDHRVVEFSWRAPRELKVRNGEGKWLLRRVLDRYVPRELVERPKMGFSVPIDRWLRGELRGWAEDLLAADELRRSGLLRPEPIRQTWERFQAGKTRDGLRLWAVLMFQAWHRRWIG